MTISKNDLVDVELVLLTQDEKLVVYQHKSSGNVLLSHDEPLFEILKVLIGKENVFQGAFKFDKTDIKESKIEIIPRNGVLKKIDYQVGQIIRFENNPYRYGVITALEDDEISLETNQPFRRQNLLLKVSAKKVINS